MVSPVAVIDSVVHGKQSILSFRLLSTLLNISYAAAQSHLQSYVNSLKTLEEVKVLWHVVTETNGVRRTQLSVKPAAKAKNKRVWAIGPPTVPDETPFWLQQDRNDEISFLKQPPAETNTLRDGAHLPIVSASAAWDARPDPRYGNTGLPQPTSSKPSSLLAAVKSSKKPESKLAKNSSNPNACFKPKQAQSSSLFSSSRLGQGSIQRMKEKEIALTGGVAHGAHDRRGNGKGRRVIDDDSDGSDDESGGGHTLKDEMNGDESEVGGEGGLPGEGREPMEWGRSEADKAEVRRELEELVRESSDDDEKPRSPVLEDVNVDDDEVVKGELGMDVDTTEANDSASHATGPKRSFRETFGLPEQPRGTRRVRREVEESVEENGYIVTRRVMKTFDENGQEVQSIESEPLLANLCSASPNKENTISTDSAKEPSTAGSRSKPADGTSSTSKQNGNGKFGNTEKTSVKSKGNKRTDKSSKKGRKNIMSYFTKKT